MGNSANKTTVTSVSPATFIDAVDDPQRQADARVLLKLFGRITGWKPKMWGPGIINAPGLEGFPEAFKPEAQDLILHKKRYSAFYETELQEVLRERGCHQLMIGGVYGHIGCLATATDAFMRDFQPFLIADAIADFSLLDHETALRQVARTCGVVHHTREVCSQLLSTPHEATSERQPAS